MRSKLHALLKTLIATPSITPHDAGCQDDLQQWLQTRGFQCERMDCGPVSNLFATYGQGHPHVLFAGHTDVVPTGDRTHWKADPFTLYEEDGYWFGRGVADMKGSLACMLLAAEQLLTAPSAFQGTLSLMITSGEEGDDFMQGTPWMMQCLHDRGVVFDYCLVGEPSSDIRVGDVIKIGRRGSLTGHLTLNGKQGHVAYPHLAENPIHRLAPVLTQLTTMNWDQTNTPPFPPTTLQFTHIQAGGDANNVIPGTLSLTFNFRYSTEHTAEQLQAAFLTCFQSHGLIPTIHWQQNGRPFLTEQGVLLEACRSVITQHTGHAPTLSTAGGTSDGRFIAPYGIEVIELGPVNATIHQVNESVRIQDLETLVVLYREICKQLSLLK